MGLYVRRCSPQPCLKRLMWALHGVASEFANKRLIKRIAEQQVRDIGASRQNRSNLAGPVIALDCLY